MILEQAFPSIHVLHLQIIVSPIYVQSIHLAKLIFHQPRFPRFQLFQFERFVSLKWWEQLVNSPSIVFWLSFENIFVIWCSAHLTFTREPADIHIYMTASFLFTAFLISKFAFQKPAGRRQLGCSNVPWALFDPFIMVLFPSSGKKQDGLECKDRSGISSDLLVG